MPFDERVPKGWARVCLSDVAERFLNGGTPSTEEPPFWNGSIPWITGADFEDQKAILGRRYITPAAVAASATNIIPKGHLLIVTRTGVGKIAQAPCDVAISQDITGMIVKEEYDCRFLYWQLNRLAGKLQRRIQGTSINGLLREDLESFPIPVPSLAEQIRIARILDGLDTVISRTRAVIEQTRRLKTALLQDLLTNGLPGRHRKLVNHPRLGRIPANWRVAPLGRLCVSAVDGPFGSNLKTEHYSQSGVRVIRLQNIAVGEFDDSDRAFVPWHHFEGLKEYEALPGDLLIASMGDESHPAGRACLVPDRVCPAMIKADCFRFRVDAEQASPQYLMWFMNSYMARREIDRGSHGQTRTRLNLTNAKKVCVPIPDLPEQKIIAKMIDALHRRELSERKELIGLDNVQSALRHGLLTGKIRVEARGARDA